MPNVITQPPPLPPHPVQIDIIQEHQPIHPVTDEVYDVDQENSPLSPHSQLQWDIYDQAEDDFLFCRQNEITPQEYATLREMAVEDNLLHLPVHVHERKYCCNIHFD